MQTKITITALLLLLVLSLCGCSIPSAAIYIETWDISLPPTMDVEYEISTKGGFHYDGDKYTVFKVIEPKEDYFKYYLDSKKNENNKFVHADIISSFHDIITKLEVPAENRPDWSVDHKWMKLDGDGGGDLYVFYFPHESKLYICDHTS